MEIELSRLNKTNPSTGHSGVLQVHKQGGQKPANTEPHESVVGSRGIGVFANEGGCFGVQVHKTELVLIVAQVLSMNHHVSHFRQRTGEVVSAAIERQQMSAIRFVTWENKHGVVIQADENSLVLQLNVRDFATDDSRIKSNFDPVIFDNSPFSILTNNFAGIMSPAEALGPGVHQLFRFHFRDDTYRVRFVENA